MTQLIQASAILAYRKSSLLEQADAHKNLKLPFKAPTVKISTRMQSNSPREDGPLGMESLKHLFKETLEGWFTSSGKHHEEVHGNQESVSVSIDSRDQLLFLVAHLALLAVGFKVKGNEYQRHLVSQVV